MLPQFTVANAGEALPRSVKPRSVVKKSMAVWTSSTM
jgi:hypothetical protein